MRFVVAGVKNISLLSDASDSLISRAPGVPGIGAIWAPAGAGKTTGVAWLAGKTNAVYVRALASWTPSSMLGDILRELDEGPRARCADAVRQIVDKLRASGRPLFVDECDYVVKRTALVETLRDIHDLSTVPLLLVGTDDFMRAVKLRQQLSGRVAHWVHFQPADLADARVLADAVCEVEVAGDLLERLHECVHGSMRGLTTGLVLIEKFGKRTGKTRVTLKDYGNRALNFDQLGVQD